MVSKYELSLALEKLIKSVQALEEEVEMLPLVLSAQLMENLKTLSFRVTNPALSTVTLSIAEDKTLQVLKGLPRQDVTAKDVALLTKRARAVESMHLNVLSRRGVLLRERKGRRVFFTLKEEYRGER
jgi:DNA-binding transcriptional ArsR family regulator